MPSIVRPEESDMKRIPLIASLATLVLGAAPVLAQSPESYRFPAPEKKVAPPNTVMDPITAEARKKFVQSAMASNPLSLRDMINLLADKLEAQPGVSYDDAVAAMKQRANKLNLKFVGVNSIYKDVAAISGKPTPKVEVFNFCDAQVARELLDYSLEFVVLLPCRIAAVEDAKSKVWLMTLDWDVSWLDTSPNPDTLPDSLKQSAVRLRQTMREIMRAGAAGEF
ncbi:MAG: DUF302 domain-containing protein [Rhodocyclaceae bacterium]|nr:DUF302 domain-containing protein [Rhodocyclaceae bacterium]